MTVLTVVENTYTVITFGKVSKLVCTDLKLCGIPACVGMSRTLNTTELDFVGCFTCVNINRELCFNKNVAFFPVCFSSYINSLHSVVEENFLSYSRISVLKTS